MPAPITLECVTPELDGGRYPVKRLLGDTLAVSADIFKDGHDRLAARVRFRGPGGGPWRTVPMSYDTDADRWHASFVLDEIGRWTFGVDAWTDRFGTWREGLRKKLDARQDIAIELLEGAALVRAAANRTRFGGGRQSLEAIADSLADDARPILERAEIGRSDALLRLMEEHHTPGDLTSYARELAVTVDRPLAGFAAWYELFPRSQGSVAGRHGTFDDAAGRLPRLAELGFDVIYLPPIHPIGRTFRKGKNNALTPQADDVGSPWAIGNESGGHTAIEPSLGTIFDFDRFVGTARGLGLEIALDYALQCSPDHPWVREHPNWFHIRPDGTIKYAENPPKKYQDIYPINFWCDDRVALWNACRDILLFWIAHGVTVFRVDNPHTKPSAFWEWVIGAVQAAHPQTIFFAEAFTRPKVMKSLAKLGFTMSYTYFTWKNSSWELVPYLEELTQTDMAEYYRGNLFTNTPDILHEYLQHGGRPAFRVRLLLAATLLPLYGIYSGYELCENVAVAAGSEEYRDSEKYEIRVRDWEGAGNINADIAKLNQIRRQFSALHQYRNLSFHKTENEAVILYLKKAHPSKGKRETRDDDLLIVVNLDPRKAQETMVTVPIAQLGIGAEEAYTVEDLLTGMRYTWRGARNYVRLDPQQQAGHLLRVIPPPTVVVKGSHA
ncbi:MAG: alpha-1,4-glucan--maltose-1-phosphate maltosyltransferase [Gemmatimonadaceae bacterium]